MELLLFQILDNTSGQNSFDLGSAIAKQLNIKLSNIDGKFTGVDFDGATIKAIIGLEPVSYTHLVMKQAFIDMAGGANG